MRYFLLLVICFLFQGPEILPPLHASSKPPFYIKFIPEKIEITTPTLIELKIEIGGNFANMAALELNLTLPDGVLLRKGKLIEVIEGPKTDHNYHYNYQLDVKIVESLKVLANLKVLGLKDSIMSRSAIFQINPIPAKDEDIRKILPDGTRIRVRRIPTH